MGSSDLPLLWSDLDLNYLGELDRSEDLEEIFYLESDDYDSNDIDYADDGLNLNNVNSLSREKHRVFNNSRSTKVELPKTGTKTPPESSQRKYEAIQYEHELSNEIEDLERTIIDAPAFMSDGAQSFRKHRKYRRSVSPTRNERVRVTSATTLLNFVTERKRRKSSDRRIEKTSKGAFLSDQNEIIIVDRQSSKER